MVADAEQSVALRAACEHTIEVGDGRSEFEIVNVACRAVAPSALGALSELGAIVAPPVPAFYNRPKSLDDIVDHTVGRLLDLFGLETGKVKRWKSPT